MGSFGRGTGRRLASGLTVLIASLACVATAGAATTTRTLTVGAGADRSCATSQPASGSGVTQTRWTARRDSSMVARLRGGAADDWDLALFDARSGRRLDASLALGGEEVVQTLARRGQTLVIQACRVSGSSARLPLSIASTGVKLAKPGAQAPTLKLVRIGISSPLDIGALSRLGINLNEAPEGRTVSAVVSRADEAKLGRAGYTYSTLLPDLNRAERSYLAADKRAA